MIEIIHTPKGQEHPYEQLPEERFPRKPLAGEPFTVGIVTRPPGQVGSVSVHTRLDGTAGPVIAARRIPDWQPQLEAGVGAEFLERMVIIEQDVWQAQLAAPGTGTPHLLDRSGRAAGAECTLRGEAWQPARMPCRWTRRSRITGHASAEAGGVAAQSGSPHSRRQ